MTKVREKVKEVQEAKGQTLEEFIAAHDHPRLTELLALDVRELVELHETIIMIRAFAGIEPGEW